MHIFFICKNSTHVLTVSDHIDFVDRCVPLAPQLFCVNMLADGILQLEEHSMERMYFWQTCSHGSQWIKPF